MTIHVTPAGKLDSSIPPNPVGTSLATRVRVLRSPGGIEAWFLEDHTVPILSMQFGFRGGPALDPTGRGGTARMLANLLTEGAGSLDGGAFREALADRAIQLSFSVWSDSLRGELKTLARETEAAFELLGLALRDPRLAEDDIVRVRSAMESDIRTGLNRPDPVVNRTFAARGFAGHPYGRPTGGDLDSLPLIAHADLAALQTRMMTRKNLRVAVVGAIGPEALGLALDRAFLELPTGSPVQTPATVLQGLGERIVTRLELPQSTIRFGRPGLSRQDPDFAAATVVNHSLGGDMSSRLFGEVRKKRGLCYAMATALQMADGASTLVGRTATRNDRAAEALGVIEAELLRLSRDGLEPDELERSKGYLIGSSKLRLDTSSAISALLLGLQLDGRPLDWLDTQNARVATVSAEDAQRAAARLIGDGRLLVAIAGDPSGL
jgi:zinc protease